MRPGCTFTIISRSPRLPRQLPSSARVMFTRGPTMRKSLKATLVPEPCASKKTSPVAWKSRGLVSPGVGVVTGTGAPEGVAQARRADEAARTASREKVIPRLVHLRGHLLKHPVGEVAFEAWPGGWCAYVPGLGAMVVVGMGGVGEGWPPRDRRTAPNTRNQAEIMARMPTKGISLTRTTMAVPTASWMTPVAFSVRMGRARPMSRASAV